MVATVCLGGGWVVACGGGMRRLLRQVDKEDCTLVDGVEVLVGC
jgi:hypothetical protein